MATSSSRHSEEVTADIETPGSKAWKTFRTGGWVFFSIFCLLFFTLFKFPDVKIKTYVQTSINNALAPYGMILSARETHFSLFTGFRYSMEDVTLTFPSPTPPAKLKEITVSPRFVGLLTGRLATDISISSEFGDLDIAASTDGSNSVDVDMDFDELDLHKLALLPVFADLKGGMVLDGNLALSGNPQMPDQMVGSLDLTFKKLSIDEQTVGGFIKIPTVEISQGKIDGKIREGKLRLKVLELGQKTQANDALVGKFEGTINLGRQFLSSSLDLAGDFTIAPALMKKFFFIDAFLSKGKKPDGSYSISLKGPLMSPIVGPKN